MCTLPQGATNSLAHMVNAMNKVLRDCIPEITMSFLDDIPIKGSLEEEKDGSKDEAGCRRFVVDHIKHFENVLQELEDAKKAFMSDGAAQVSQFSNEITNSTEICKAIANKKIELATEAYMRVRILLSLFPIVNI